jgi:bacillolysin
MSIRLRRELLLVALIVPGVVVGALLSVGVSSPTEAQPQQPSAPPEVGTAETAQQQQTAGSSQLLSQLNSEGARVHRHQETGELRFIGASKDNPIDRPPGLAENASPEAAARAHMAELGELFGIHNQASELRAESSNELDGGRADTHFQQVHEGVPVLGGELNAQVDDANNLLVATGEILPEISLDTEPGVEAKEAQEAALAKIAKDREIETGELQATEPELWIYDPSLLGGPGPDVTRLVWRMDVTPAEGIVDIRELVLVDAQSGAAVLNFDQIDSVKNRNTHDANNTSALPGTLICNESNSCTDVSFDADVRAAHLYAGQTYDFYLNNHARDSINNAGMTLTSTADYCHPFQSCPYRNAFWNGQQMVYGDGFAAADDVVGHELTHGVTENESHLFYYYQSGAINESFSDVWGEFIDLSNTSGTDTADTRWKLGEDVPIFGAIRDMEDPPFFGDPDRMLSSNYTANFSEDDSGGVHTNSGVNNKAAYLMTDGGTFNGKTVTALGITKVAKIYYEAQTNLLTSASDYQDLHSNLRQACTNLTGTSGITSVDCAEVQDAVDATEMHLIPPAAPNPEAPVCPTDQTATNLFNDNLENTASGNWTTSGTGWYYPQNTRVPDPYPPGYDVTYATSGTTNFWGDDRGVSSDHSITKATGVTPPTGKTTYLRFNHAYGFEDGFDGGVLEYSTNNGSTWNDAGPLITNNGYNGTINALGGRQGFTAESNGYISSRVNLSSLAGQSVRFRFRIGEDGSVADYGWFVDDVRVYTCEGGPIQTPANDAFASAQALTGANATVTGTNVNATKESGEPNHAGNTGGKSVWYKWTPQASGTTTIDTAGSNFDTLLAIYTGGAVNSLSQVASNNDADGGTQSKVSFTANAGTTYQIAVDGFGAAAGNINLRLASTDTTAPTARAPTHTFTTLSTLATSTVPVKLTWSATDNPGGSGIASYQLQQSINGGAYTNALPNAQPSTTATTISRSLAPGTNTYRYRVAAKDNAGNLSAWATGPSFKVTAYQESSSAIVDTGSWTTSALSGAYGGSVQYASALGRNATFSVPVGTKNVEWVSYRGPNRGNAQVWLDGVQQDANPSVTGIQPFDLYSSSAQARKVVFSKAVSSTTSHNLQVRVLGQKNASSTSTRVDIDAFVRTS